MEFLNSDNEWEEILESELTIDDCNNQITKLNEYYSTISNKKEKEKIWFLIQDIKKILESFTEEKPHYTGVVYPVYNKDKLICICSSDDLAEKYISTHTEYNLTYNKIKLDEEI